MPKADSRSRVAYVTADERARVVRLSDRITDKTIATSTACAPAVSTTFDSTGKRLAVAGAAALCVLEVPSLRLLQRVSLDAPAAEIHDGPDAEVHFLASDLRGTMGRSDR